MRRVASRTSLYFTCKTLKHRTTSFVRERDRNPKFFERKTREEREERLTVCVSNTRAEGVRVVAFVLSGLGPRMG